MSRTIFAALSLTLLAGCQRFYSPNYGSIVTARLQTVGPNWTRFCGANRGCDDCIPHRPFTLDYRPAWDYHITEHAAHCCAFRAFDQYRKECGQAPSHHFKMGFTAAYEDLALNRRPSPPAIPPSMYWNAYYRSCAGKPFVEDWFAGYDAGLNRGSNSGVCRFREIYLRRNTCGGPENRSVYDQASQSGYGGATQFENGENPQYSASQEIPVPASNGYATPNGNGSTSNPYGVQGQ